MSCVKVLLILSQRFVGPAIPFTKIESWDMIGLYHPPVLAPANPGARQFGDISLIKGNLCVAFLAS